MRTAHRCVVCVVFASLPAISAAQVRCTMPNGLVIIQQLSLCPNGATKSESIGSSAAPIQTPQEPQKNQPIKPPDQNTTNEPAAFSISQWLVIGATLFGLIWLLRARRSPPTRFASKTSNHAGYTAADVAGRPLKNQTSATTALATLLANAGYARRLPRSLLQHTLNQFNLETRDHRECLRSDIALNKEERTNQLEMLEQFEENIDETDPGDGLKNDLNHITEIRCDIAKLTAQITSDSDALASFNSDRAAFVAAYANHLLYNHESPARRQ